MNGEPMGSGPVETVGSSLPSPSLSGGSRLYTIADLETLGAEALPDAVEAMADAGVPWVQVRAKGCTDRVLFRLVEESCRRVEGSATALWVDDRADVAALLPVMGVHVGQSDLPPVEVRRVVGAERWIGLSTHDAAQVETAEADETVDVVAVGPVFATRSKKNPDPVVGLALVRRARSLTAKHLVAIGGIDADNLGDVLAAGADRVAVLGAACRGDVYRSCLRLVAAAEEVG